VHVPLYVLLDFMWAAVAAAYMGVVAPPSAAATAVAASKGVWFDS
jgi:hypothetical protein